MGSPFYTGACSDCGEPVETSSEPSDGVVKKGTAFSCQRVGTIYLLCEADIKKRKASRDPALASNDWAPGPKHRLETIERHVL